MNKAGFVIGLIIFIIGIIYLVTVVIPSYNEMKIAQKNADIANADAVKAQQKVKQLEKEVEKERQSFINRGCTPQDNIGYKWLCP